MAKTAILAIRIISDTKNAQAGVKAVGDQAGSLEKTWKTATKAAAVMATGLTLVGKAAFDQASLLQQAGGAAEAVFKGQAKEIEKLAKAAQSSLGLSRSEYLQTASVFGAQLKNMGVAADELVPTTDKLMKLGGDLAATFGGTTADAVESLSSLLRGERDPIEKYGVSIKQADINARLAAQGQSMLEGEARKAAETEATLAILYEQTADAQGQRARESGTAQVAQENLTAAWKNAAAELGTALLPAITAAATALAAAATFANEHSTATKVLIGIVAGLTASILAVNAAMKVYAATKAVITAVAATWKFFTVTVRAWTTAKAAAVAMNLKWQVLLVRQAIAQKAAAASTVAMTVAQKAWQALTVAGTAIMGAFNAVMAMNPIVLVVLAVVALTAALVLAYQKSETFRNIVQQAGQVAANAIGWVVDKVSSLVSWFRDKLGPVVTTAKNMWVNTLNAYLSPVQWVIDKISSLVDWIKKIKFPSPPGWLTKAGSWLGKLVGSYHVYGTPTPGRGASTALAPSVFARPGDLHAAGSSLVPRRVGGATIDQGVTIVIQGAVDPVSTARQVRTVLRRASSLRGEVYA